MSELAGFRALWFATGYALLSSLVGLAGPAGGDGPETHGSHARAEEADSGSVAVYLERACRAAREPSADEERALALEAAGLKRQDVLRHLRAALLEAPETSWRRAATELLVHHAQAEDLSLFGELVLDESGALASEELAPVFRDAIEQVLERIGVDGRELHWLVDLAPVLRTEVVRAVGASGRTEGLSWLGQQLAEPTVVAPALQEIARLAQGASLQEAVEVAPLVRPFAYPDETNRCRHAVHALGVLEDVRAVPQLIDLLEVEGESGLGRMAHSALRRITGRDLPPQAQVWRRWYEEEVRWREDVAPLALEQLDSEQEARVIAAIHSLSEHGLYRHALTAHLVRRVATHPSAVVRGQLCLGLGRLGSRAAVDGLVLALSDEDLEVRGHALTSLRLITGLNLPPQPEAWVTALAG